MPKVREERWRVFYGDVQVGTIGIRAGLPIDVDQWGWTCGSFSAWPPKAAVRCLRRQNKNVGGDNAIVTVDSGGGGTDGIRGD